MLTAGRAACLAPGLQGLVLADLILPIYAPLHLPRPTHRREKMAVRQLLFHLSKAQLSEAAGELALLLSYSDNDLAQRLARLQKLTGAPAAAPAVGILVAPE